MADITFDELDHALRQAQIPIAAAEAHGIICGSVCSGAPGGDWEALILGQAPITEDGDAGRLLRALHAQTRAWLDENEMGFQLYIPDDEHALAERAEAVADWCRGFMLGLAASGVRNLQQLPGNAQEVLHDFAAISELTVDTPADDEQERALAEIEEYMRVGTQLVYEELRPDTEASDSGG